MHGNPRTHSNQSRVLTVYSLDFLFPYEDGLSMPGTSLALAVGHVSKLSLDPAGDILTRTSYHPA